MKTVRIVTGKERIDDVSALYDLRARVRQEAEECGVITENSVFPLSIGLSYVSGKKNRWILNMKYRNCDEWKADCQDYIWEFQVCTDEETGELYAVRPFKLPSGKVVCCMFSPFSFKEYTAFHPVVERDVYSVMNSLLDMLYLESIVEYDDRLYISSKDMFVIGTPLDFPQSAFLFNRQSYYKRMVIDEDAPQGACVEMLHRSMKLLMDWEGQNNSQFVAQTFFRDYQLMI